MSSKLEDALDRFFADVRDSIADRVARDVRTLYFIHETLTPGNVRAAAHEVPLQNVPQAGDVLQLENAGEYGRAATWRVTRVEATGSAAFTVYCEDAP